MMPIKSFAILTIGFLACLAGPSARADFEIYVRMANVSGDSLEKNHRDWIEVRSFSYAAQTQVPSDTIELIKDLDGATAQILRHVFEGTRQPRVILDLCYNGLLVIQIEMSNAVVTSSRIQSVGPTDSPFEQVQLRFEEIVIRHYGVDMAGKTYCVREMRWTFE